ncbi:MAG: glycogen synthase [Magnetococcales bacterium]|nr:glycogen synthase [Magnetococcales bacterium]MBF0321613.1 glycogen synthase [Magnetococcales bacterium]
MHIIVMSAECAPVAKVGGLADMVYGLCRELGQCGHALELILPRYDCMRHEHVWGMTVARDNLEVPWWDGFIRCTIWFGLVHGIRCYFVEPHGKENFFNRGAYYGFPDEVMRFAFFCKAALEFLLVADKRPDILHTHDWQTAMGAVLLYEMYQQRGMEKCRVCHTIHNFRHQGVTGLDILKATGLNRPKYFLDPDRLQDDNNAQVINLTKGAVVYSNFITTVSRRHAWEARFSEQGFGMGHALHIHQDKFGGILNGLDYDMWNPESDPLIPHHFATDDLSGKVRNKDALRQRLRLAPGNKPIVAHVGRLDTQKGVPLIRHALFTTIANDAQFVLLGISPECSVNDQFLDLKSQLANNPDCSLEITIDEDLAHLIYAGADMCVIPSLYEPCGLSQMIALRYGVAPIVRAVGGLADTIFDWDYATLPREQRNGFVFEHADNPGVESALFRALGLYRERRDLWRQLQVIGMKYDFSWRNSAGDYLNIYEFIRHK